MICFGYLKLLLGGGQRGARSRDLGFRFKILRLRIVDFLLRHQAGTSLGSLLQSRVSGVSGRVRRLRARQVSFSAADFLFGATYRGVGAGKLRCKFGDFQDRERLSRPHMVADIDVNHLDVAGYLRMNVDVLEWLEFSGDGQCIPHTVALGARNCFQREKLGRF